MGNYGWNDVVLKAIITAMTIAIMITILMLIVALVERSGKGKDYI